MAVKKSKGKQWFSIHAPKLFGEREIGKTLIANPEALIGRKITLSLMELTNDFSKYYMKFIFQITKTEGDKAYTEFVGSECLRDYISRMILRHIRRIDAVQDLKTKDGLAVRIKGLGIMSKRAKSSIEVKVRNQMKETMKREVEKLTLEELVKKLLSDELKNKILNEVRRIYPVRNFIIRKAEAPLKLSAGQRNQK